MKQQRPFPFHELGYRRNPFGALTPGEWAAVAVLPPVVEKVWQTGPPFLQLLGEKGSGKTSILLLLADRLNQAGERVAFEHLPENARRFQTSLKGIDVFILDEAQRLRGWEKRRLIRQRPSRLILSSHQDLGNWFRRQRLPLVSLNLEEAVTPAHVTAVLEKRLDFFALPNRSRLVLAEDAVAFLHRRFSPDLRAMAFFLYEVWQCEEEAGSLTAVDLTRYLRLWETAVTQTAQPL